MDNVSILFADIAGFTQVCAQKSATQVVSLLNDLYRYFDDLCGDCYYCVAGCPVPQSNHAEACVEMGLGLCRIMKRFNKSYQERMNLRVGVHTGKVNAAIIGQQRFRYDVYSYDVSIANALANCGLPGRVHISEATYTLVKHVYEVATGPGLDVKQEIRSGLAGMVLDAMEEFNANYIVGSENFELKIGYNCGAVTAGIIGIRKPFYDVWGDTVNVASRMHMTGKPGIVQAQYEFESLGEVFVRGKGLINTYSY
ncbi:adenylate/guanylate cyclase catalytic domain protein [Opisthorchis viverrini]|uniref:adenylate cyclase n=1 Tax=Opisthorchis viverrini TaxID=6198 RepID=A0A1S8WT27_OPIVI|nr:adenylate/guanylate cyclase catalytic domain protein [Opisthorchis viverrini]